MIVLANDSFFMAMFFFLSGLFVWPGLSHKAPLHFVRDRLLRLGLPFVIAALILIPIAYYALALQNGSDESFATFWHKMVTVGPWPSGPVWFVWVLLAFDLTASLLYRVSSTLVFPINKVSELGFSEPWRFWLLLVAVTEIAYIPPLIHYGVNHWFQFGPFSVQASRVLLYASYFFIGAGVGCASMASGVLSPEGQLPTMRWKWLFVTLLPYAGMWCMIFVKREILDNPPDLPWWYHLIYGTFFVLFSASIMLTILGFFLHDKSPGPNLLDRMQGEAYGMFLVHYPIVLWIQYFLFDVGVPAIVKATIAFVLTVILSWGATAALRKIPGATRVL
jgi:Acyltransferase family